MSILPTFYVGTAFAHVDPESVKNTVKSSVSFYAFGIYERKICTKNVGEIDSRWPFLLYFVPMMFLGSPLIDDVLVLFFLR